MSDQPPPTPPGWHDDPNDPTSLRYWDGEQWTESRAPKVLAAPASAPLTTSRADWPQARIAAVGGAIAIMVGSVSPWATVSTAFGSISVNGADGGRDGVITLVGGGVVALLVFLSKYLGSVIVSALTGAVLVFDLIDINRNIANSGDMANVSVGWGLWLATGGAAVAFVMSLQLNRESKATQPIPIAVSPEAGAEGPILQETFKRPLSTKWGDWFNVRPKWQQVLIIVGMMVIGFGIVAIVSIVS